MQIGILSPQQVLEYWPDIRERLEGVEFAWTVVQVENLAARAQQGEVQTWVLVNDRHWVEVVLFSEVQPQPRGRVLAFKEPAVGANIDPYLEGLRDAAVQFSRMVGAEWIEVEGRMGWQRKLRRLGFRPERVTLTLRVNDTVH